MYKIGKISLLTVLGGIMTLAFTPLPTNREFEISKNLEIFANLFRELNNAYVDELDPGALMGKGLEAMVASLDPFTNYFAESDIERYRILQEGSASGVGLSFRTTEQRILVSDVFKDMAADKAGVKIGDQLIAIDGRSLQGRSTEDVDYLLRGAPGSTVEVTIRKAGGTTDTPVKLTRDEREAPNVPHSDLLDNDIAYVSLTTFTQNAGRNVANALRQN